MAFAQRLPHDKPAVCRQLVQDSVWSLKDQAWMCENIMYNAIDAQNQTVYNHHLDNFEAMLRDRFSELGEKESQSFYGKIQMFRGVKHTDVGEYAAGLADLDKALKIFEAVKDTEFIYQTLIKTANNHAQNDNFIEATDVTLRAGNFVKENDLVGRADYFNELAYCYGKSRNNEKAKAVSYQSIKCAEEAKDTPKMAQLYSNLSTYFVLLHQGDSSLWAIQKSYAFFASQKQTDGLPYNYLGFGGSYKLLGDYDKALDYSKAAFRIFDSLHQHIYSAVATNLIGDCYQTKGDWQQAKIEYNKALRILDSFPKRDLRSRIYDSLTVLAFQERGDVEGLRRLRASKTYLQTQFSTERRQIVENMNVRYETAERNEKINDLNKDKAALQFQLFLGFLFILSALTFLVTRNRQQKAIMQKENEILAARAQVTKTELYANKLQLDGFTTNILTKNQLISDLEARISQLSLQETTPPPNDADEYNRGQLANMKILTDDDWRTYLKYFKEVHTAFMHRVEQELPDLTAGELRLFLLLKQGFDSKDMADVLGISIAGIKKSRYRLRKKLNLSEEDNLEAYVEAF